MVSKNSYVFYAMERDNNPILKLQHKLLKEEILL